MTFLLRVVIVGTATLLLSLAFARAQQPDFGEYHRTADYCRSGVPRPMALSPDRRILCFDGGIWREQDYSVVRALDEDGFFVVRSYGGDPDAAILLARLLAERRATVVVYDYCLSACAQFLLIAPDQTFVLKDSLVAWHEPNSTRLCPFFVEARDRGPKRFEKRPCSEAPEGYGLRMVAFEQAEYRFYRSRLFGFEFEMPPESATVRRRLQKLYEVKDTCVLDLLWMWHPRYYASVIKTKVLYEKYPDGQREVDVLASKYPFLLHVLYDP
jgi:hypothetical protein